MVSKLIRNDKLYVIFNNCLQNIEESDRKDPIGVRLIKMKTRPVSGFFVAKFLSERTVNKEVFDR